MSRTTKGGFRRRPRIADLMNHELLDHAALEWHRSVPMFRRNRHVALMEQLVLIGEEALPEWAWARWITYQALRCGAGETGATGKVLLTTVVHTVHEDLLQECFDREGDPVRVAAAVYGESWVFHQMAAHSTDMVAAFLDEHARGRLAEHTDLVRRWTGARMSGYQLLESLPGARLVVREAGTDATTEILDLGARSAAPGDLTVAAQAYVAAAALQPRVQDDVRRDLVRTGHPDPWVTWAARSPKPARGHLLALTEAERATA